MIITKQEQLKNIDLPETIYKYRDWLDDYHKSIITKRQVFLAPPDSFEDKLDCKIPIRYDLLTDKEIYDKYLFYSKIENPRWSNTQHENHAREWTEKTPLRNLDSIELSQEKFFSGFCKRFGVLSLTAEPANDFMWAKYSNDFKGFCVGFNTVVMFNYLGGGGNVIYYDELPIIYPEPKHSIEEQHSYQVYSKERKWEFEKEYRTHKFSYTDLTNDERIVTLPPEAYKCLILGKNMTQEIKESLRNSIPKELSHIEIIDS
jgi:Protein of unknown function (DUF2971).